MSETAAQTPPAHDAAGGSAGLSARNLTKL